MRRGYRNRWAYDNAPYDCPTVTKTVNGKVVDATASAVSPKERKQRDLLRTYGWLLK